MDSIVSLGLTGGIGSGKSFIGHLLEQRGYPRYDTDSQAKRLTRESQQIREALIALLGSQAYLPNGDYNRPFVATLVFQNSQLLAQIEAIVHPVVYQDFRQWANLQAPMARDHVVLFETALLPRLHGIEWLDFIVSVAAPEALRLARATARDATSQQKVLDRMASQPSQAEFEKIANFVLRNDGLQPLEPQLDLLTQQLHQVYIAKQQLHDGTTHQ